MLKPSSIVARTAAAARRTCRPLATAVAHAHHHSGGGSGSTGGSRRWRAALAAGVAVAGAGAAAYAHSAASEAVSGSAGGDGGSAPGSEADRLLRGALERLRTDPGCVPVDEAQGFLRPLLSAVRRAYGIPPPGRVPAAIFSADDPAPRPPSVLLMLLDGGSSSSGSSPGASAARRRGSTSGDEVTGEVIFRGRLGEMHQPPTAAAPTAGASTGSDRDNDGAQPPQPPRHGRPHRHGKEPYAYMLLLHLQEAYPQQVGALLVEEPGAATAAPADALSAPPVLPLDGDGVLRLPIPSGELVIDVGAAPDVEVRWRVHRSRRQEATTQGGGAVAKAGAAGSRAPAPGPAASAAPTCSGGGLTYADLDAVASVFSLGAVAYAHAKHAAAEARAAALPDGAAGAPGRAKAFLHAQAERQEALAGILPRLSLLLRLNHVLGWLPGELARHLDPDAGSAAAAASSGSRARARRAPSDVVAATDDDGAEAGAGGLPPLRTPSSSAVKDPVKVLTSLGVKLYSRESHALEGVGWDNLAGYDHIRKEVESSVLFPMAHPELYAAVAAQTRAKPEPNQFGAYVFTGPPGTGKTTAARIVAALTDKPLVVLSFENVGSAYYSQSETNLQKVLDAVAAMPNAILFVDEADAMFPSRYSADMHGGTTSSIGSKLLSQVLKFVEGIAGGATNSVIFATNRPAELDPALLSRCAASVRFELPDAAQRAAIFKRYAKQLSDADIATVVARSDGMSGRDIKRAAEVAERRHAAALQRAGVTDPSAATPPPVGEYVAALEERAGGVLALQQEGEDAGAAGAARRRNSSPLPRKLPDDVRV